MPQKSPRQLVGVLEAARWAPEPVWPPAGKEIVTTSRLIRKPALELDDCPRESRPRHAKIVAELTG